MTVMSFMHKSICKWCESSGVPVSLPRAVMCVTVWQWCLCRLRVCAVMSHSTACKRPCLLTVRAGGVHV